MRTLIFLVVIAMGLFSMGAPRTASAKPAPESDAVLRALVAYHDALGRGDGKDAVRWATAKTVAFYDEVRELALHAQPAEVRKLSPLTKLTVLIVRAQLKPTELKDLDGAAVMALAVERGWISREPLVTADLGKTTIKGDEARIEHKLKGKATWTYRLLKEKGDWRFDVTSAFPAAEVVLQAWMVDQGKKEEELLLELVKKATGTQPTEAIWQALE